MNQTNDKMDFENRIREKRDAILLKHKTVIAKLEAGDRSGLDGMTLIKDLYLEALRDIAAILN